MPNLLAVAEIMPQVTHSGAPGKKEVSLHSVLLDTARKFQRCPAKPARGSVKTPGQRWMLGCLALDSERAASQLYRWGTLDSGIYSIQNNQPVMDDLAKVLFRFFS